MNSPEFSPEMTLLLSCSYGPNPESQKETIRGAIHGGINWNTFIQLAHYHQILPLVVHLLHKYAADLIPASFLQELKTKNTRQKIRAMKLTAEWVRLVKLFKAHDIPVISLKGPGLAHHWYGDVTLRHFVDIDLFIQEEDLHKIHPLLLQEGYVTAHPELFTSPTHWRVFRNSKHHVPYHHHLKAIELELHFRLFKNPHVFPNSRLSPWNHTQTVEYAGFACDLLAPLDNVLFLLIHGSIHQWCYLKWLVDIAQWRGLPCCDWEKLYRRALPLGLERPVLQGMWLLNHLFNIPLPPFCREIPVSSAVKNLTDSALTLIKQSRAPLKGGFLLACHQRIYLWQLKKGARYKLRYVRDLFYLDSHRDILRLPAFLFPLYIIMNPFLWLYKNYLRPKMAASPKVVPPKKC